MGCCERGGCKRGFPSEKPHRAVRSCGHLNTHPPLLPSSWGEDTPRVPGSVTQRSRPSPLQVEELENANLRSQDRAKEPHFPAFCLPKEERPGLDLQRSLTCWGRQGCCTLSHWELLMVSRCSWGRTMLSPEVENVKTENTCWLAESSHHTWSPDRGL